MCIYSYAGHLLLGESMSVVDEALDKAFEDAVKRFREASEEWRKGLETLIYDLDPLTVASRTLKAGGELFERARPPTPDQVAENLPKYGIPTPKELAEAIPRLLPSPKQLVDAVESAVDPTSKVEKLGLGIGLPLSILASAVLLAIVIALKPSM